MKRNPRPLGTTFLAMKYQKSKDEKDYQNLINHLIKTFVVQGFTINNENLSLENFSLKFQIPSQTVKNKIQEQAANLLPLNNQIDITNTIKQITNLSMNWAIQDRGLIQKQTNLLLQSQGDKYKPFISSTVNQTLDLLIKSNQNFQTLYKNFFQNLDPIFLTGVQENQDKAIDKNEAFQILEEELKELPKPDSQELKELESKYQIKDLPDLHPNSEKNFSIHTNPKTEKNNLTSTNYTNTTNNNNIQSKEKDKENSTPEGNPSPNPNISLGHRQLGSKDLGFKASKHPKKRRKSLENHSQNRSKTHNFLDEDSKDLAED